MTSELCSADGSPAALVVANLTCALPGCDVVFDGRRGKRYCRPEHAKKASNAKRNRKGQKRYYHLCTCIVCGIEWESGRKDAKYHSDACKGIAYSGSTGPSVSPACLDCRVPLGKWGWCQRCERRRMAEVRLAEAAAGTSGVVVWLGGTCPGCDTPFVSDRAQIVHCSEVCARRVQRRRSRSGRSLTSNRKRARYYGCEYEPIRRLSVYERDAYICGICLLPTTPHAAVPDWNAPTVDHVVPMSRGGGHVMGNVQCAHFICNTRKGVKVIDSAA